MPEEKRLLYMLRVSVLPRGGLVGLIPSGDLSPLDGLCRALPALWKHIFVVLSLGMRVQCWHCHTPEEFLHQYPAGMDAVRCMFPGIG